MENAQRVKRKQDSNPAPPPAICPKYIHTYSVIKLVEKKQQLGFADLYVDQIWIRMTFSVSRFDQSNRRGLTICGLAAGATKNEDGDTFEEEGKKKPRQTEESRCLGGREEGGKKAVVHALAINGCRVAADQQPAWCS